ncbi:MAG: hypothetical protein ACKVOR_12755 [Flavobacteriales bacterium]
MFTTTIRINTSDLNQEIISSIKTMFGKKKDIEIVVSEAMDETEYLLRSEPNKKLLLNGKNEVRKKKNLVTFSPTEFDKMNKRLSSKKSHK